MSNDFKSIKVENLYRLQEDIENFILRNQKQFNSLAYLKN
ncbi:hypothetical protein H1P_200020 [Hyella patelloides LEGE 07179]|uniref:Uncharacterized protein n=1 Tax=Hyella patelloides LEGE 07179 TaxID=945734 RepID=A0A563VPU3_9CYAN|nr:hypothetical protein H1P_200020 [Hyella patelloides LEGE 07179]